MTKKNQKEYEKGDTRYRAHESPCNQINAVMVRIDFSIIEQNEIQK